MSMTGKFPTKIVGIAILIEKEKRSVYTNKIDLKKKNNTVILT